jgi:ribosomal protein S12 methylthiotransferase accessory factor YcaO
MLLALDMQLAIANALVAMLQLRRSAVDWGTDDNSERTPSEEMSYEEQMRFTQHFVDEQVPAGRIV